MFTTKIWKIILGLTVLIALFLPNSIHAASQSEVFYQKGNAYYDKRKFDLAIVEYTKAIALNSQNADYYMKRAAAYKGGRRDLAIDDYNQVLRMNPDNQDAYNAKYDLLKHSDVSDEDYDESRIHDASYNPF